MTTSKNASRYADELSFMRRRGRAAGGGVDCWVVEPTGDYTADCEIGHRLAEELMTYLGRHPTNGNRCLLQWIVLDMIRQEPRLSELKGIEVGFLSRVGDCFMYVARMREELVPGVIVVT